MTIFAHQTIKVELYHRYVVVGVVGINMGGGDACAYRIFG
jgi:hypothetical protein